MKRILALIVALFCLSSLALTAFATLPQDELDAGYLDKLSGFSAKLYSMTSEGVKDNYVMSPISVYFALAMVHAAGDDTVRAEIESFLGMTAEDLGKSADLFRALEKHIVNENGETETELSLSNSVWVEETYEDDLNEDAVKMMEDKLVCETVTAPFRSNNKIANEMVGDFIKEATNGRIDRKFNFDQETLFLLINTLYLIDKWNYHASDLSVTPQYYRSASGVKFADMVIGYYRAGRVQETDCSYFFYTTTYRGYKVKLILPKDGYTLADAMSCENVERVNGTEDYKFIDEEDVLHYTRCIFPEYSVESDTPLFDILANSGELEHTLSHDGFYSTLIDDPSVNIDDIIHVANLDVNRKGVEGAAATIVSLPAGAPAPPVEEYHDFVINKNFGYLVTSPEDVVLFAGQITDPYDKIAPLSEEEVPSGIEQLYDGSFAIDIANSEEYKAEGVGGVKFSVSMDLKQDDVLYMALVGVTGADEDKITVTDNGDGTATIELRDAERIAEVPAGDTLIKVVYRRDARVPQGRYDTPKNEGDVIDAFKVTGTELIAVPVSAPAVKGVAAQNQAKQLSKQTGDPLILYVIIMASASLLLVGSVMARKKNND